MSGSDGSSMGESKTVVDMYLGVGMSAEPGPDAYGSNVGNVWLRGLIGLLAVVAGSIGRAVNGGTNGLGAVPESGVKKGEVGLNGPGEKDDGAVSVNALFNEFVLCEWKGPCRLPKSR